MGFRRASGCMISKPGGGFSAVILVLSEPNLLHPCLMVAALVDAQRLLHRCAQSLKCSCFQ